MQNVVLQLSYIYHSYTSYVLLCISTSCGVDVMDKISTSKGSDVCSLYTNGNANL